MLDLNTIQEPTLLLNENIVRDNISRMVERAAEQGVRLRPHFKTHQSAQIGEWFREQGINAITVSSCKMAQYFAEHGWKDITIASSLNPREIDKLNQLAKRIKLHAILDSADIITQITTKLSNPLHIWLDIDTGYKRSGLVADKCGDFLKIVDLLQANEKLHLTGLFAHAGHTYQAKSKTEVEQIHQTCLNVLQSVKQDIFQQTGLALEISVGDTPSSTMLTNWGQIDENRPGTFVFGDVRQMNIGSCKEEEIGVVMACPVIGKYEERSELIIYGGGVHLSKDFEMFKGQKCFGRVALFSKDGWGKMLPDSYISHVSQEVGTIKAEPMLLQNIAIGDLIVVFPAHICLTANLMKSYTTLNRKVITRL